jgi:phage-related protein
MAAIVATIMNFARRLFDFFLNIWDVFVSWIYVVWDALMRVIDILLSLFVQVFVFLAQFLADVLIFILWLAVSILPVMPEGPSLSGVGGIIS